MSESNDDEIDPFIPDENPEDFEVPAFEEFGITGDESGSDDSVIPNNSDADLLDRIEALEARINNFPLPQPLFPVFVAQAGTGSTWEEVVPVNGTLTAGGPRSFTGDTVSGAAIITLAANQSAVVESKDPGTTNSYTRFIAIGGGGSSGSFFPVLVSHNGDDGGGLPLYDLYALADTGHVTKLNLSGAIAPAWSVPRTFPTAAVTAAVTNSVGMAYMTVAGPIALYFVIEAGC